MPPFIAILTAVILSLFCHATAQAGSHVFGCSDASGQLSYDGRQLTFRRMGSPAKALSVNSRKISETPLATRGF